MCFNPLPRKPKRRLEDIRSEVVEGPREKIRRLEAENTTLHSRVEELEGALRQLHHSPMPHV